MIVSFSRRLALSLGAALLLLAACNGRPQSQPPTSPPQTTAAVAPGEEPLKYEKGARPVVPVNKRFVTLKTTQGIIKIKLYPADAPISCDNFVTLVDSGYYNGTIFHRVIPGFVAQGGDPQGTGEGGPGWRIPFEAGKRKHLLGSVGMARSNDVDSGGSQFYICLAPQKMLDGKYVVFGEVIEGIDVARKLQITEDPTTGPVDPSVPRDKILEAGTGAK